MQLGKIFLPFFFFNYSHSQFSCFWYINIWVPLSLNPLTKIKKERVLHEKIEVNILESRFFTKYLVPKKRKDNRYQFLAKLIWQKPYLPNQMKQIFRHYYYKIINTAILRGTITASMTYKYIASSSAVPSPLEAFLKQPIKVKKFIL